MIYFFNHNLTMSKLSLNEKMIVSKYLLNNDFFKFTNTFNITDSYFTTFNYITINDTNIKYGISTKIINQIIERLQKYHNLNEIILNIITKNEWLYEIINDIKPIYNTFKKCLKLSSLNNIKIKIKIDKPTYISIVDIKEIYNFIENHFIFDSNNKINISDYNTTYEYNNSFNKDYYNIINIIDYISDVDNNVINCLSNFENYYITTYSDLFKYKYNTFEEFKNNCILYDIKNDYRLSTIATIKNKIINDIKYFPLIYEFFNLRKNINLNKLLYINYKYEDDLNIILNDINKIKIYSSCLSFNYYNRIVFILKLIKYSCINNLNPKLNYNDISEKLNYTADIKLKYMKYYIFNTHKYGENLYFIHKNYNDELLNKVKLINNIM